MGGPHFRAGLGGVRNAAPRAGDPADVIAEPVIGGLQRVDMELLAGEELVEIRDLLDHLEDEGVTAVAIPGPLKLAGMMAAVSKHVAMRAKTPLGLD